MSAVRARRRIGGALAALALLLSSCGSDAKKEPEVTVLSRNLYLGADLAPLFAATPTDLATVARATYDQVVASDVEARMAAVAGEIVAARPDLVALQEATIWRTQAAGATAPTDLYDFVALLLARLADKGAPYRVASSVDGFGGGLPVEGVGLVTMQDRDVILVREASDVTVGDPRSGTFDAKLTVSIAGAAIEVVRGWTSVSGTVEGRAFRLVGTHLEAFDDDVRDRQQAELVAELDADGKGGVPTLLLGDLNSAADGADPATYQRTLDAGFEDAWTASGAKGRGFTCCRDADLRGGDLSERIDYVLFSGGFDARSAAVVGDAPTSRTPRERWSSDHAGIRAVLTVPGAG